MLPWFAAGLGLVAALAIWIGVSDGSSRQEHRQSAAGPEVIANDSGGAGTPEGGHVAKVAPPNSENDAEDARANPADAANSENSPPSDAGQQALPTYPDIQPSPRVPHALSDEELRALGRENRTDTALTSEVGMRLGLHFNRWRGRQGRELGGFKFVPGDYPQLEGWTLQNDEVRTAKIAPPCGVERHINLGKGVAHIYLRIFVAIDIVWAHQVLVERAGNSWATGPPNFGDDHGVNVGDVYFERKYANSPYYARHNFCRRNVVIDFLFDSRSKEQGETLDARRLALQIDNAIRKQSVSALKWTDLAPICPKILEFAVESPDLPLNPNTPRPVLLNVAAAPDEMLIYFPVTDQLVELQIGKRESHIRVAYGGEARLREAKEVDAEAWVVVCDRQTLLFSVARVTVVIRE